MSPDIPSHHGDGCVSRRTFFTTFMGGIGFASGVPHILSEKPVKEVECGPWFKLHEEEYARHTQTGRIARCYRGHIYLLKTAGQKPVYAGECDICPIPNCRYETNELGGMWQKIEKITPHIPEEWKYSN